MYFSFKIKAIYAFLVNILISFSTLGNSFYTLNEQSQVSHPAGSQKGYAYSPNDKISGYLVYLPKDYYDNPSKKYPLVVFFHGAGEYGTDLNKVKRNGPPKMVEQGKDFPFILISPQARYTFDHNSAAIDEFLEKVKPNYRIDNNRFYVTGLSMGGAATWYYANNYPDKVAAAIPICGWGNPSAICEMKNVPVWAFHNQGDNTVPVSSTTNTVNALKRCADPQPKMTIYPIGGHDAWTATYNNDAVWQWLLSQSKNSSSQPIPINKQPIAKAGEDKTLTLPENSITLNGKGEDADGSIISYIWTKSSGPNATLTNANTANLKLTNLVAGSYVFKLTVTDNKGAKASDEVKVTVIAAPLPSEPSYPNEAIYVNFNSISNEALPWNNTASTPYSNKKLSNLKDKQGKVTSVSLTLLTRWGGAGSNPLNSPTMVPKNVASTYYWTNSWEKEEIKVSGLNKEKQYNFEFYAYKSGSGNRTTDFTIGSKTVSLNAANNTSNSVFINNIAPNKNGEIIIAIKKGAGSDFGYLSSLIISESSNITDSAPVERPNNEVIYRVNAGGNKYDDGQHSWEQDSRSKRSKYLHELSYSDTYDHTVWGKRKNSTQAPNFIFESNRYEASWSNNPLSYKFPVPNDTYIVNLYFAEYDYSPVKGKGQRVFNIKLENKTVLSNFDIYGEAGNEATQKSFTVTVQDGILDISLEKIKNQPIISGIEIIRAGGTTSASQNEVSFSKVSLLSDDEKTSAIKIYPNPVVDKFKIELFSENHGLATIRIANLTGETMKVTDHQLNKGYNEIEINIGSILKERGLFFVFIQLPDGEIIQHKLLKN